MKTRILSDGGTTHMSNNFDNFYPHKKYVHLLFVIIFIICKIIVFLIIIYGGVKLGCANLCASFF